MKSQDMGEAAVYKFITETIDDFLAYWKVKEVEIKSDEEDGSTAPFTSQILSDLNREGF